MSNISNLVFNILAESNINNKNINKDELEKIYKLLSNSKYGFLDLSGNKI